MNVSDASVLPTDRFSLRIDSINGRDAAITSKSPTISIQMQNKRSNRG